MIEMIEKLEHYPYPKRSYQLEQIENKINEIIDVINGDDTEEAFDDMMGNPKEQLESWKGGKNERVYESKPLDLPDSHTEDVRIQEVFDEVFGRLMRNPTNTRLMSRDELVRQARLVFKELGYLVDIKPKEDENV